jgi:hypothetical protein
MRCSGAARAELLVTIGAELLMLFSLGETRVVDIFSTRQGGAWGGELRGNDKGGAQW